MAIATLNFRDGAGAAVLIDDAEDTTDWDNIGGGMFANGSDVFKAGTSAIFVEAKDLGVQGIKFDAGTALGANIDFTVTDRRLYMWILVLSANLCDSFARGGVRIYAEDGSANWGEWFVGGNDIAWVGGGFKRIVIDLTRTPDNNSGTNPDISDIQWVGADCKWVRTVGKAPSLVLDQLAYGTHLEVTGGSDADPVTLDDILAADLAGSGVNHFTGFVDVNKAEAFEMVSKIVIGDESGALNTVFKSTNEKIVWGDNPLDPAGGDNVLTVSEDTGTTKFLIGNSSGTGDAEVGFDGSVMYAANDIFGLGYQLDLSPAVDTVEIFASTFQNADDGIILSSDTGHKWKSNAVVESGQVDPKQTIIRKSQFNRTAHKGRGTDQDAFVSEDGGVFTDETTESNNATANDMTLLPTPAAANDRAYWGWLRKFDDVEINVGTAGAGTYTLSWDYWNGSTWSPLTVIEDSYAVSNQDATQVLGNATIIGVGQSITGAGGVLLKAQALLSKTLLPLGTFAVAKIYAHSGTFGTSSIPTGSALATSKTINVTDLTGTLTLTDFIFEDGFLLVNTTKYVLTIEYSGGDSLNFVNVGTDTSSPTHGGNFSTLTGSTWTAVGGTDQIFLAFTKILTDGTGDFKTAGSNRVTFAISSDWAKTVVDSSVPTIPLYFIRATSDGGTRTTQPLGTQSFVRTSAPDGAALLWNATIDMEECSFLANTDADNEPHAIEHDVAGTRTYDNLKFAGNDFDVENSVAATTEDSYAISNRNATQALGNGTIIGVAQSITGAGGVMSRARFILSKTLAPTGNAVAKIYAHSGTFGTSSIPTGTALATSKTLDVTTLTTTLALIELEFEDEFTLVSATKYVLTLEYSGGDASNFVNIGTDTSSPTHGGNFATLTGSTWSAVAGTDAIFFAFTGAIVKVNATNGSDPLTDENTGIPPGATIIVNTISLKVTVRNQQGDLLEGMRVRYEESDGTLIGDGETNASGVFDFSFNFPGDTPARIIIRRKDFEDFDSGALTITSAGFDIPVRMLPDVDVDLP